MEGIATIFEGEDGERIRALWRELEREFGLVPAFPGAEPHLTFHIIDAEYPPGVFEAALGPAAARHYPFPVRTAGLGVFGGEEPVVYIAVVRDSRLSGFHAAIDEALRERDVTNQPYYVPDAWVPHLTLAQENLAPELLPGVLAWCARRPLAWDLSVTNVTAARIAERGFEVKARLDLGSVRSADGDSFDGD